MPTTHRPHIDQQQQQQGVLHGGAQVVAMSMVVMQDDAGIEVTVGTTEFQSDVPPTPQNSLQPNMTTPEISSCLQDLEIAAMATPPSGIQEAEEQLEEQLQDLIEEEADTGSPITPSSTAEGGGHINGNARSPEIPATPANSMATPAGSTSASKAASFIGDMNNILGSSIPTNTLANSVTLSSNGGGNRLTGAAQDAPPVQKKRSLFEALVAAVSTPSQSSPPSDPGAAGKVEPTVLQEPGISSRDHPKDRPSAVVLACDLLTSPPSTEAGEDKISADTATY